MFSLEIDWKGNPTLMFLCSFFVATFFTDIAQFLVPEINGNGMQKLVEWGVHPHFKKMQKVRVQGGGGCLCMTVVLVLTVLYSFVVASTGSKRRMAPSI